MNHSLGVTSALGDFGFSSGRASNGSMSRMMQELDTALVSLQSTVISSEQSNEQGRFFLSDTIVHVLQSATNKFVAAMQKVDLANAELNSASGIQKTFSYIMDAVQMAAGLATGQVALFVFTAIMTALNASGAITAVEKAISNDLQNNQHLSKGAADCLADSLITGMLFVASLLTMRGGVPEGVPEDADDIEMQEMENGKPKAQQAPSVAEQSGGTSGRVLFALSQAVINGNFAMGIASYAASSASKENQWKIELALEITISLIAAVAGIAGMKSLGTGTTTTASLSINRSSSASERVLAQINGALTRLVNAMSNTTLFWMVNILNSGVMLGQGVSSCVQGAISSDLAKYTKESAVAQSKIERYKALLNMVNTHFTTYQQGAMSSLQGVEQMLYTIGNVFTEVNAEEARLR